nr:unnamed protein product [Callosobruchus analis]
MPRHCCVPGCKINYSSELRSISYRSVFRFPKKEVLKSKWLAAIPRKTGPLLKNPKFSQLVHFY